MLHGICILIHRIWKNTGRKLPKLVSWFITINLVNIFWVFFRAESVDKAFSIIFSMFDLKKFYLPLRLKGVLPFSFIKYGEYNTSVMNILIQGIEIIFLITIILFLKNSYEKITEFKEKKENLFTVAIFLFFSILYLNRNSEFLYFNF